MHQILKSPLGFAFVAVRENASRAGLVGYNPYMIRLVSFVFAGFFAGVAGVLFALFSRYVSAQYLFWTVSGEGVVWMIVGGAGTLFGPVLGAAFLIVVREELSVYWEHYLLAVGVIVILCVTYAPQGIMGLLHKGLDHFWKSEPKRVAVGNRRRAGDRGSKGAGTMSAPVLQVEGLTKRFGGLTAVDNVDFTLPGGGLHAIIGPNGAGKTTFFNLISGFLPANGGRVIFNGENILGRKPHEISRLGIARTLQIKSVFNGLSVYDNVWIAAQGRSRFLNPFRSAGSYTDVAEKVAAILDDLGLSAHADALAGNLSYGDIALLEIAIALATEPELMLLDEPVSGMSPDETARTVDIIRDLSKRLNVILIEHDMEVVFGAADVITVMNQGAILCEGSPEAVARDARVQEAYLGTPEDAEEHHA